MKLLVEIKKLIQDSPSLIILSMEKQSMTVKEFVQEQLTYEGIIKNREDAKKLLDYCAEKYAKEIYYLAPELMPKGRNPALLIRKMVECIPEDSEYDWMYNGYIVFLYKALQGDICYLRDKFWSPMGDYILGETIGETDTEWKKKMIDYWMAVLDINKD